MEGDSPSGRDTSGGRRLRIELVEARGVVQPKHLLQILHLFTVPKAAQYR